MKKVIFIVLLIVFNCNFLTAQKFKKELSITKSSNPLEINPKLDFEVSTDIDSTLVSKETLVTIKKIQFLLKKDQNQEALNLINTISKIDLEKNELFLLKGILEFKLDNFSASSNSFLNYAALTTNDSIKSSVHYTIGVIDLQRNLKISAFNNFKKSFELDAKNYTSCIVLGGICMSNNEFENAIFYYKKALEVNSGLNNVWNNLAFIYQKLDKHLEAKNIFTKIIKDEPDAPLPYSNRSYSNLKLGFTKQALKDVNKSIKLFPENSYAFRNRALIYIELKQYEKACFEIETAYKLGYQEKYGSDLDTIKSQNCKN
ncbi:tetratricopeptide repeat protein [Flavobacterium sp.]|uniref:tetratricopeptide repeat protein n=1 Tax=Flavobacterium sp. TaxID=239 RepID=UPI0037510885